MWSARSSCVSNSFFSWNSSAHWRTHAGTSSCPLGCSAGLVAGILHGSNLPRSGTFIFVTSLSAMVAHCLVSRTLCLSVGLSISILPSPFLFLSLLPVPSAHCRPLSRSPISLSELRSPPPEPDPLSLDGYVTNFKFQMWPRQLLNWSRTHAAFRASSIKVMGGMFARAQTLGGSCTECCIR